MVVSQELIKDSRSEPVQMHHLRDAAYSEYMKLERTLTDAEIKGWNRPACPLFIGRLHNKNSIGVEVTTAIATVQQRGGEAQ
jgi:hypothetical protein